jgi:hypothetical protein
MRSRVLVWTAVLALAMSLAGCGGSAKVGLSRVTSAANRAGGESTLAPTVPANGTTLFGVHLDWTNDSPVAFTARSGISPSQYGDFISAQPSASDFAGLAAKVKLAAAAHANIFLSIEPFTGLAAVTPGSVAPLVKAIASYNKLGVWFYLRFAHEMNGGWYPWGQQPTEYVRAFRVVATAIHTNAAGNLMVWSPNYGGGYPFSDGAYNAKAGSADFTAMDTNHDGVLNMADDPYLPFYPGDSYVDWVGLTLYYFGATYPYGANIVPDNRFEAQINGTYNGVAGDERALPNFYQEFAVGHKKPMAISETAALYNTSVPSGASEASIKKAWISQVFNPADATRYPELKMINWFEFRKPEAEDHGIVDWRATFNAASLAQLKTDLATKRFTAAK